MVMFYIRQKSGTEFAVDSKLTVAEMITKEKPLGSGLKELHQRIENNWVKVYDDSTDK